MKFIQCVGGKFGTWFKMFWIFLFFVCTVTAVCAQHSYSLETVPNVHLEGERNHVSNPDNILSVAYVDSINRVLNVMEDSTGIEVAVVAITSVGDNDARLFASDLFNRWGIGEKGKDNGLLVMLVTEEGHRKVIFETGYGLEGDLPDATCYSIQQKYMIADLKQGNYDVGILKGIRAISDLLYGGEVKIADGDDSDDDLTTLGVIFVIMMIVVVGAIYVFVVIIIPTFILNLFVGVLGRFLTKIWPRTCPKCGKRKLQLKCTEVIEKPTFKKDGIYKLQFVCNHCGHKKAVKQVIRKYGLFCFFDQYLPSYHHRSSSDDYAGFNMNEDFDNDSGGGSSGGGGASSDFD